eukprot:m.13968 g.13968  ORF g.13968 m.13968 type:complete len:590 (-) comp2889_c0_seq2:956-2725(-)
MAAAADPAADPVNGALAGALGALVIDLPLFKLQPDGAWHYRIPPSTAYSPVPTGECNFFHDIWNPSQTPRWKEMEALKDVQFLRGGFDTRSYKGKPAVGDMGCVKWSAGFASHAHGLAGAFIVVEVGLDLPVHNMYYHNPDFVPLDHPSTTHGSHVKIVMEPFPAAIRAAKIPRTAQLGFNQEHADEFYKQAIASPLLEPPAQAYLSLSMYKVDLPLDPKEQARIDAKRIAEEQRRSRIFNDKQRAMGLDLNALSGQIEEKKRREAEEKEWHAAADAETLRQARIMELLARREENDRKAIEKADLEFRATQQHSRTRREFDLNDPDALKKTAPLRSNDSQENLGVASLQVFDGEDPQEAERKRLQGEQQRQWLQQQRDQARAKKELEEQEQRLFELQELSKTQHIHELSSAEEARRQQLTREAAEFNKKLADAKANADKQRKHSEQEANAHEMLKTFHSDLLSENPSVASPAPGFGVKVLSDRYKGMSDAERQQYREAQAAQVEEKRQQQQQEAEAAALWDRQSMTVGRTALLQQRQTERARVDLQRQQVAENLALAAEQKARREHENKIAARNIVTDDFHGQFNKSSR